MSNYIPKEKIIWIATVCKKCGTHDEAVKPEDGHVLKCDCGGTRKVIDKGDHHDSA